MSLPAIAMPPYKVAAAALRKTTERLAREVVRPSNSAPDWSDLEWAIARAASAMQGISGLLASRIEWSGPPLWQSFLKDQREQLLLRDSRIGGLLQRLDEALRETGSSAIALKGAAIRELNIYRPGERPMSDIDLLVRPDDAASIESVLHRLDYVYSHATERHAVFVSCVASEPSGFAEHVDNPLTIEVHTKVTAPLPVREVDVTDCLNPSNVRAGLNPYPTIASLLLHELLHSAGNMRAHEARQIQFHDIALLAPQMSESDWQTLLVSVSSGERRWWLYPPLAMTDRYYPGSIPAETLGEAASSCPRALRRWADRHLLTDISWSNLRICAVPGISWARTPLEAARLIRNRAWPKRAARVQRERFLETNPRYGQIAWYRISQGHRILRWLFSRPPRVPTMLVLRSALQSARNLEHA